MSMTPPGAGAIHMNMVVINTKETSVVKLGKLVLPIEGDNLLDPSFRQQWIQQFLAHMEVPENFYNGRDCNMIKNMSTMLRNSVLQCSGVETEHISVIIMLYKTHCAYNVVNAPIAADDRGPSREMMMSLACGEGSDISLPAGASTLERFTIQAEDKGLDNCPICLKDFNTGDHAARILPCSHVHHYHCILQWFVYNGTCPVCRYTCGHASF